MRKDQRSLGLGAHIPVELQNKSLVVKGTVRVMRALADTLHIRAIQADVMNHVLVGEVGWKLDEFGRGIGRHFAKCFQDPTLVKPDLPGRYCRTTLIEGNDHKWYVVEVCERLDGLNQLGAEFHDREAQCGHDLN